MTTEAMLLQKAANEIETLRMQNQLMSARLEMFDNMMSVLHTDVAQRNIGGMALDLVWEIRKYVEEAPAPPTPFNPLNPERI